MELTEARAGEHDYVAITPGGPVNLGLELAAVYGVPAQ